MGDRNEKEREVLNRYRLKAQHYACACMNKNNSTNVHHTPGELIFIRQWNNMQYVSSTSFLLTVYSEHLRSTNQMLNCPRDSSVGHQKVLSFVKSQVDYILGSNPMGLSYLVGYGPNYPKHVHHRGASMEPYKDSKVFVGCTQGYDYWYGRKGPNLNVLVGALVGGPNSKDEFEDRRGNFAQTEACTYNTAPLIGVFAKLHSLEEEGSTLTDTASTKLVSST